MKKSEDEEWFVSCYPEGCMQNLDSVLVGADRANGDFFFFSLSLLFTKLFLVAPN